MTYSDPAHDATDAEIRRLAKRLHAAYGKAYREMERKAKDALARQSKADAEMVRRVSAGDMTTDQLVAWRRGRAADTTWYTQMVAELAREMGLCDERAAEIYRAMAVNIAKRIGSLAPVVNGKLDAVILTGGIARSKLMTGMIREYVSYLAPIVIYPGENEMYSLALGGLRIRRGEEQCHTFTREA